ncbi:MAG: MarR family winged helix-turn-helix transcriptional regulator [Planctomycetota bacterium]|jgi:DNA-binding MarR family transcriptional regulator
MGDLGKLAKKRRFDSPEQQVYLSLWRSYDRLRAIEEALFNRWNLTAQQYNVLRLLEAKHPEAIPTLQLSSKLISRAPDITRMLDKLETQGWIRRDRSSEDRRAVLVALTPKGLALVKEMASSVKQMHVAQVGHLTVDQTRSLLELLEVVRAPHEPMDSDWKT